MKTRRSPTILTAGEILKGGSELSCHLVDVLELFSAIFYNGAQWVKFPMGKNLKIQNHRILDICLEIISTKFGRSR